MGPVWPPLIVALGTAALALSRTWDYDVWFHLACGRAILESGSIPDLDIFSYTAADRPWDSQEWLSQIFLYLGQIPFGLAGIVIAKTVLAAATLLAVHQRAVRLGAQPWISAALCVWAAYIMRWHLVERPQMLTYFLLAIQISLLEKRERLWVLLPISLLWANFHGGAALLAPGVFVLWIVSGLLSTQDRRDTLRSLPRLLAFALALGLLLCVNPAGPKLLIYPFITMADRVYMATIREWTPPSFAEFPGFFSLLALSVAVIALGFRRWSAFGLLLSAAFCLLALTSRRHIPLFCLAVLPPLAAALSGILDRILPPSRMARALYPSLAVPLAGLCVLLAALKGEALRLGISSDQYPANAVGLLGGIDATREGGGNLRLFSLHKWGGFFIWNLPRRWKVFIDGRQLVYGQELFLDYYRILEDLPSAEGLLERTSPDFLVLDYGTGLGRRLAQGKEAALIHWDDNCLVYAWRTAANAEVIRQLGYRAFNPEREVNPGSRAVLADIARAQRASPGHSRPWLAQAALLLEQGRFDEAHEAASAALLMTPGNINVLSLAAEVAIARQDLKLAHELLILARRKAAGDLRPRLGQAKLEFARARREEGLRHLEAAIYLGEVVYREEGVPPAGLGEAYQLLAAQLTARGEPIRAAENLRLAGNVFFKRRLYVAALASYRQASRLAPGDVRPLHNIGSVYLSQGRFSAALQVYAKALELAPNHVETLVAQGVAYYRLNRTQRARESWQRALALRPDHPEARRYLEALSSGVE